MSAWYVLSSMGIYAVTPGLPNWSVTNPYFSNIKVNFENKSSKIINKDTDEFQLRTFDAYSPEDDLPPVEEDINSYNPKKEFKKYNSILSVPIIQTESKSFKNKMKVAIISQNPKDVICYNISDKNDYLAKKLPSVVYTEPFEILETSTISAYVKNSENQSNTISATFFKKPNNYTIDIKSTYNPQYHAGGTEGLIDGIHGTENWRKGDWQGYQSQDFEAIIDLQLEKNVSNLSTTFLQDQRSWILMPTKVEYYSSIDNVNYTLIKSVGNDVNPKIEENTIKDFGFTLSQPSNARYIKVKAYNFGKLPEWHQGVGGDAFIFIDEITIK
jgi:hypothetical protein